jgi:multiple sugar transport system substrate-binding protein
MVVNLDLLNKAGGLTPKTWEAFRDAADKLSKLPGIYPFGLPGKEIEVDTYFYYPLWSFGGDIFKNGRSGLDSPEAIQAANLYHDLIHRNLTEPSPTAYSREEIFSLFKQGKVGMVFSYPMLIPQLKAEAPNLHYAVMPFPTDRSPSTLGVTDVMVRFSGSKVQKEAWDFAQFAYRHEYRSRFDRDEGFLPVTNDVLAEDYYKNNPDISAFAQGLAYAHFVPTIKNWPQIADITTRALQSMYLGDLTPEVAMKQAAQQIDKILNGS